MEISFSQFRRLKYPRSSMSSDDLLTVSQSKRARKRVEESGEGVGKKGGENNKVQEG